MNNQPEQIIVAAVKHHNPYPLTTHRKAHALFCYGAKQFLEDKVADQAASDFLSSYPSTHPTHKGYMWCAKWDADPNGFAKQNCEACGTELFIVGGMAGTGLCGPCCTGESATLDEAGTTW